MREGKPTIPVEVDGKVVGRIVQLGAREFMARAADGTRCGFHGSLTGARAAILDRASKGRRADG